MTGANSPQPDPDFSEFGDVELCRLTPIEKATSKYLARNWAAIPHVTHNDEADVTEALRLSANSKSDPDGRISLLSLAVKAATICLQEFPRFNASLNTAGDGLILKKFFNIGVAVDTPRGLLVPVVQSAGQKDAVAISDEIAKLAEQAREKGLAYSQMTGGCFTISSLGGYGGTGFTPIVNGPEVAILGLSRSKDQPRRNGDSLIWRTFLPLSLSYDHRVINGADAAKFTRRFAELLENPHQLACNAV